MSKKIIIDRERCIGCGLCANTCHQSAIEVIDGKATVVREEVCDGLGRCLPVCPVSAITFSDEGDIPPQKQETPPPFSCPGSQMKGCSRPTTSTADRELNTPSACPSQLNQWPVQIKLVPVKAPYFEGAHLLVAADCSAFSYGNFHETFMKGKVTLIGCPKLDEGDYSEKLTKILSENPLQSVTVVRMEVPCCGGIERATLTALERSGREIPWKVVTLSLDGRVLAEKTHSNL